MDAQGLTVRFRDCTCPGTPHDGRDGADDGDIVTMRPSLGFAAGAEALRKMMDGVTVLSVTGGGEDGTDPILDDSRLSELVGPVYIREGVTGWNVVGEAGSIPCTPEALEALPFAEAYEIAEHGDALYSQAVMAPLLRRMSAPSGKRQNGKSTRPPRRSSKPPRSPRVSSSQNGSAGKPSPVSP